MRYCADGKFVLNEVIAMMEEVAASPKDKLMEKKEEATKLKLQVTKKTKRPCKYIPKISRSLQERYIIVTR